MEQIDSFCELLAKRNHIFTEKLTLFIESPLWFRLALSLSLLLAFVKMHFVTQFCHFVFKKKGQKNTNWKSKKSNTVHWISPMASAGSLFSFLLAFVRMHFVTRFCSLVSSKIDALPCCCWKGSGAAINTNSLSILQRLATRLLAI